MAELRIEKSYYLGDIEQLGQEVDGTLYGFRLDGTKVRNKSLAIEKGDYSPLETYSNWEEVASLITAGASSYGVRSRIGVGLYSFRVDTERVTTRVRTPLRLKVVGPPPKELEVIDSSDRIQYKFSSPQLEKYESYRVIFKQGSQLYEFITYEEEGELSKPWGMEGEFTVQVRGHRYEIQELSKWSDSVVINIASRPGGGEV